MVEVEDFLTSIDNVAELVGVQEDEEEENLITDEEYSKTNLGCAQIHLLFGILNRLLAASADTVDDIGKDDGDKNKEEYQEEHKVVLCEINGSNPTMPEQPPSFVPAKLTKKQSLPNAFIYDMFVVSIFSKILAKSHSDIQNSENLCLKFIY